MNVIGLDVGGANLKACDADGNAHSVNFPMWQQSEQLPDALNELLAQFPSADLIALTMTGELADCFATKADGVTAIIDATVRASGKVPVRVWLTSGEFAEADDARELTSVVAAANWHALATWAALAVPDGPALLLDMGSTTTDLIPLLDGRPVPVGLTDVERLASSELIYTGAGRTPICSLLSSVTLDDHTYGIAAEFFATMADAWVFLGRLPEAADNCDTADGRPLTRAFSANRLAHLLCCDHTEVADEFLQQLAEAAVTEQRRRLSAAAEKVEAQLQELLEQQQRTLDLEPPTLVVSGSGGRLVSDAVADSLKWSPKSVLDMASISQPSVAAAACAFAVARLAQDRCADDLLECVPF